MRNWEEIAGPGTAVATADDFNLDTRHGGRYDSVKRMVEAMIDEALDDAKARSEQRAAVYGACSLAFAAVEEHLKNWDAGLAQALALFESGDIDLAQLDKLRSPAEHRRVVDAIAQSILDVYGVLSSTQRMVVADHVRARLGRS
jgi:hypothetical protein